MLVAEMQEAHPRPLVGIDADALAECIEACLACAQACTSCADACLHEEMVADLRRCIRLNQDCADLCDALARILTRGPDTAPGLLRAAVRACADACRMCGDECATHAEMHEHCRICAEACRRCEQACLALNLG
ncbi:four-helix bundle copper-binding protein [Sporichthya polymorpha]|uniref:four-helix bundle copper-binding protein n=1 Tax=Sporichthya polymorpha TaxID=35751 RepID=UPI00036546D4|nr:four-helix bundle copper-binding protein [Sporichthya polymorpha]